MISLREFHDFFKSINPWESDAEAFVRTDADGIVYVPSSMIADEEQRQAAYDEMDEEGSWISFPDASELRLGKDVALRYAERFLSEMTMKEWLISSIAAGLFDVSRICLTSAASSKSGTRLRKLANSRRSRSG